jgi:hypothetical protein
MAKPIGAILSSNSTLMRRMLSRNYTPADKTALEGGDADLGSTSPVLLDGQFIAQDGKDGRLAR